MASDISEKHNSSLALHFLSKSFVFVTPPTPPPPSYCESLMAPCGYYMAPHRVGHKKVGCMLETMTYGTHEL